MPEPSNSNLESSGYITIAPDFTRHVLRTGIHFTTTHLQPTETHELLVKMFVLGKDLWGVDWAVEVFKELSALPCEKPEISIPSGKDVNISGETECD